jgi:hypothetical protein
MKVIKNFSGDAHYGVLPYIQHEFDRLSDNTSSDVFLNGVQFIDSPHLLEEYYDAKRRALLAHWSPCEFLLKNDYYYFDAYEGFTEVYCVCPFTCDFMNKYFGQEKFIYIPYPYTNTSVTEYYNYDSTACWFGSINGEEHAKMIDTIRKFSYKYITSQQNTWLHHPYEYNACTHVNLTTADKLKEVSKTKASLTFNKLYRAPSIKVNLGFQNNPLKIWDYYNTGILPQFKVRTHEIASCKSLILCHKDPWNLIEDFYEEGKHFIYFETFEQLEDILTDVEKNIDKYIPFIEAAYEQSQKYSVENIFKFIKTKDKSLINWKNKNYGIL